MSKCTDKECEEAMQKALSQQDKIYNKIVKVRNKRLEFAGGDTTCYHFAVAAGLSDALRLFKDDLDYLTMGVLEK